MIVIECDYHPSWQQICWVDTETGETGEQKLEHRRERRRNFTVGRPGRGILVLNFTSLLCFGLS